MVTTTYSSGTETELTVKSGNTLEIVGTATAFLTTVSGGGTIITSAGGRDTITTVQSNGSMTVGSGGTSVSAQFQSLATQTVMSSGAVSSAEFFEATQVVLGGLVSGGDFVEGAVQQVSGGVVSDTLLDLGGSEQFVEGGVVIGTIVGGGDRSIASGGTVSDTTVKDGGSQTVGARVNVSNTIISAGGEVIVEPGATIHATSVTSGSEIDFAQQAYTTAASASIDQAAEVLNVVNGGTVESFDLVGNVSGLDAETMSASDGSLEVIIACYVAGTRILTDAGELAVEQLAIGDRVITGSFKAEPVRWIGRRSYAARFLRGRPALLPVRITAGALEADVPHTDLLVSPAHAMLIDGVLVQAADLVNGTTILLETGLDLVEYVHIELAQHDVVWANGAASETFVDDDSRAMFSNAAEYAARYPDAVTAPARYMAVRIVQGPVLEAIRRRLAAIAAERSAA